MTGPRSTEDTPMGADTLEEYLDVEDTYEEDLWDVPRDDFGYFDIYYPGWDEPGYTGPDFDPYYNRD